MPVTMYNILYCSNEKLSNISCSNLSLSQYISKLQTDGQQILHIYRMTPYNRYNLKVNTSKLAISKCYNQRYAATCRKVKNNTFTKAQFKEIVELLNTLKDTCQTKEEFEHKFKKYNKKH